MITSSHDTLSVSFDYIIGHAWRMLRIVQGLPSRIYSSALSPKGLLDGLRIVCFLRGVLFTQYAAFRCAHPDTFWLRSGLRTPLLRHHHIYIYIYTCDVRHGTTPWHSVHVGTLLLQRTHTSPQRRLVAQSIKWHLRLRHVGSAPARRTVFAGSSHHLLNRHQATVPCLFVRHVYTRVRSKLVP